MVGLVASLMLLVGRGSGDIEPPVQIVTAGAGFMALIWAIFGAFVAALLFLLRRRPGPGTSALVFVGASLVFAAVGFAVSGAGGDDPWMFPLAAFGVALVSCALGRLIAVQLLFRRRLLTAACLAVCVLMLLLSLGMLIGD